MIKIIYPKDYIVQERKNNNRPACSYCFNRIEGRHFFQEGEEKPIYCMACWLEHCAEKYMCTIEEKE